MRHLHTLLRRRQRAITTRETVPAATLEDLRAENAALRNALAARASTSPSEIPPVLIAAASCPVHEGQVVTLDVAGEQVIAVIGDEPGGSPLAWWAEISRNVLRRAS